MANQHLQALEGQEEQRRISKADLLQPKQHKEEVYLDSLEGTVVIQTMSNEVRQLLRQKSGWGTAEFSEDTFNLHGIVYSVVEPKLSEEDVQALAKQNVNVIDELIGKITLLNMMGRTEELKKDSEQTKS